VVRDFLPESILIRDTCGGQRCPQVFEGTCEDLLKRKPHEGNGLNKFSALKKLGAAIGGSAQNLSPIVESVLPERDQLL